MDFGGNLSVLEPPILLQIFDLSMLTGRLELATYGNRANLYFDEGKLIFATLEEKKVRIGEVLVKEKKITRQQLKKGLKVHRREDGARKIGEILIQLGYLERDELVSVIQEQMKFIIFEVLTWKQGHFIFYKDERPNVSDIYLEYKMDFLLIEGSRQQDELSRSEPIGKF